MATYDYVCKGQDDGAIIGSATSSKLGFFGATPASRQTVTATSFASTGIASTSSWAFSTSTLAINFVKAVDELLKMAANLGLVST